MPASIAFFECQDVRPQHRGDGEQECKAHGKLALKAREAARRDRHAGAGDARAQRDGLTDTDEQRVEQRGGLFRLAAMAHTVARKEQDARDDQCAADKVHIITQLREKTAKTAP